ncbi:hypothetical protein U3450_001103 [Bacillus cytotoxicus]|nr:hypothetical protein [Bacillus cytotoxicus]
MKKMIGSIMGSMMVLTLMFGVHTLAEKPQYADGNHHKMMLIQYADGNHH